MGKYSDLQTDIFSIFNSDAWKSENIKTYPSNFIINNAGNEFIRVSIIPSGPGIQNINSVSGVILVDIFTPLGSGPARIMLIADKLDLHFSGKSTQTQSGKNTFIGISSLDFSGIDKDNSALYRGTYSIPFNHFGVF